LNFEAAKRSFFFLQKKGLDAIQREYVFKEYLIGGYVDESNYCS
jgi:hypothetical protein